MTSPISHVSRDSSLRNTYVAAHANLILLFEPALYSSYFSDKTYAEILTVAL